MDDESGLPISARVIPVPTSVSPQAQAFLARGAAGIRAMGTTLPSGDQTAAAAAALAALRPRAAAFRGTVETIELAQDAKLYRVAPEGRTGRHAEAVYFDVHGGGFVAGGGEMCVILAQLRALDYGVEVWAVDYRLAPNHAFPAALDDCVAAYRHVLAERNPANIVAAGASAGGNLVAATLLRARDEGLPLPIALIMSTPATDLTGAGDTRQTNRFIDVALYGGAEEGPNAYLGQADARQPLVSPVYGDFSKGWPPTLLTSGTRDLLLSDTVRMHRALRKAGIPAELHVTEAGGHTGFMGAPEDLEIQAELRRFCNNAWKIAA